MMTIKGLLAAVLVASGLLTAEGALPSCLVRIGVLCL